VHIVAPAPPRITLKGDAAVDVKKGTGYLDDGATAANYLNENITQTITATVNGTAQDQIRIDTTKSGAVYDVVYTVTDKNGSAEVTRTINVVKPEDEKSFFEYCFISNVMN